MQEKTLLIIKPNGMPRWKYIYTMLFQSLPDLTEAGMKHVHFTPARVEALYGHVKEKMGPRWEEMAAWLGAEVLVALILEGEDAVRKVRELVGTTDPRKAAPGTLRAVFGDHSDGAPIYRNAVHSSDSPEAAAREINLFF